MAHELTDVWFERGEARTTKGLGGRRCCGGETADVRAGGDENARRWRYVPERRPPRCVLPDVGRRRVRHGPVTRRSRSSPCSRTRRGGGPSVPLRRGRGRGRGRGDARPAADSRANARIAFAPGNVRGCHRGNAGGRNERRVGVRRALRPKASSCCGGWQPERDRGGWSSRRAPTMPSRRPRTRRARARDGSSGGARRAQETLRTREKQTPTRLSDA